MNSLASLVAPLVATFVATLFVACKDQGAGPAKLVVKVVGVDGKPFRYESKIVVNWFPDANTATRIERELPRGTSETSFDAPAATRGNVTVFANSQWLDPLTIEPIGAGQMRSECVARVVHEPIRVRALVAAPAGSEEPPGKLVLRARTPPQPRSARLFPAAVTTSSDPYDVEVRPDHTIQCDLPNALLANGHDTLEIGWRDVRAVIALGHPLTLGELDLGEVRLQKPVPIASGVIVDAAQKPILGAVFEVRDADTKALLDPRDYTVTKLERGHFTITGWTSAKRVALVVTQDEHARHEPKVVAIGAKDIVITMPDAGTVVATCKSSRAALPDTLELWLTQVGASDVWFATSAIRQGLSEVRVTWRGLAPGTYVLHGRAAADRPSRDLLSGVTVREKAPSDDPRLANLDLSELLDVKG